MAIGVVDRRPASTILAGGQDDCRRPYLRVADVQSIYEAVSVLGLPSTGIPRVVALEDKPWGLREFAVVDPDGNLLRIGQVI